MATITQEQQAAIAAKLDGMTLPSGLGDEDNACSIAAINLALTGQLTDEIPDCMSLVIGKWIISVQDAMPDELRNSPQWKALLPLAAGTGRDNEQERLTVILDWMWVTVLPSQQTLADKHGFGAEWRRMTTERNKEAAGAANTAAMKVALPLMAEVASAASVVTGCGEASAWAASAADSAAAWAARAQAQALARDLVAAHRAHLHRHLVVGATDAAALAAAALAQREAEPWDQFDPCGVLERLIAVGK